MRESERSYGMMRQMNGFRGIFGGFALGALSLGNCADASDVFVDTLRATVRITAGATSGTSWLVQVGDEGGHVLVTAAHVFKDMKGEKCTVVFRRKGEDGTFVRAETKLPIRNGEKPLWVRHAKMDVAVIGIEIPDGVDSAPFALGQIATAQIAEEGRIRVGGGICIACFPAKLEANPAGWPVLRKGSIASHPLTPLASAGTFFVDSSSFGGDSGAPVVAGVDGKAVVVGLVTSMQRQTDKTTMPFEERTVHTPLGLGIVVQAPFVREVIEQWRRRSNGDE